MYDAKFNRYLAVGNDAWMMSSSKLEAIFTIGAIGPGIIELYACSDEAQVDEDFILSVPLGVDAPLYMGNIVIEEEIADIFLATTEILDCLPIIEPAETTTAEYLLEEIRKRKAFKELKSELQYSFDLDPYEAPQKK